MTEERKLAIIIDDSGTIRTLVAGMFNKHGFQTLAAETMELAFMDMERQQFDIAVVDIFMPGMGGIEGIRKIRETCENVKILAISAGHDGMDKDQALKAALLQGADAVLAKPFEEEDLMTVINGLLDKQENLATG